MRELAHIRGGGEEPELGVRNQREPTLCIKQCFVKPVYICAVYLLYVR